MNNRHLLFGWSPGHKIYDNEKFIIEVGHENINDNTEKMEMTMVSNNENQMNYSLTMKK